MTEHIIENNSTSRIYLKQLENIAEQISNLLYQKSLLHQCVGQAQTLNIKKSMIGQNIKINLPKHQKLISDDRIQSDRMLKYIKSMVKHAQVNHINLSFNI